MRENTKGQGNFFPCPYIIPYFIHKVNHQFSTLCLLYYHTLVRLSIGFLKIFIFYFRIFFAAFKLLKNFYIVSFCLPPLLLCSCSLHLLYYTIPPTMSRKISKFFSSFYTNPLSFFCTYCYTAILY